MEHRQHRQAAAGLCAEEAHHLVLVAQVEVVDGLIQEHEASLADGLGHGTGDEDALLLAA